MGVDVEAKLNRGLWPGVGEWVQDKVGLAIDVTMFDLYNLCHSKSFRHNCLVAGKRGVTMEAVDFVAREELLAWGKVWSKYYPALKMEDYLPLLKKLEARGHMLYLRFSKDGIVIGLTVMLVTEKLACFYQFFWEKGNKDLRRLSLGAHQLYMQIEECKQRDIKHLLLRGPQEYKLRFNPRKVNYKKGETVL